MYNRNSLIFTHPRLILTKNNTIMKKTFRLMALVAMAAGLAFAACDRDEPVDPTPVNPTPVNPDDPDPVNPDPVNPETAGWVDLGLPSGLLWAECNLGATKPEEYGDYYAWGETSTKEVYDWSTYKYCNGDYNQLTKYCNDPEYGYNGFTDHLTTLQPSDDVATQKLGNGARMPTETEWNELRDNTTSGWTTENGVYGRKLTAANGKSLFFPAAGGRHGSGVQHAGEYGICWSSSLGADFPLNAWGFYFGSDGQGAGRYDRPYGYSVRAVCASQN